MQIICQTEQMGICNTADVKGLLNTRTEGKNKQKQFLLLKKDHNEISYILMPLEGLTHFTSRK